MISYLYILFIFIALIQNVKADEMSSVVATRAKSEFDYRTLIPVTYPMVAMPSRFMIPKNTTEHPNRLGIAYVNSRKCK